MPEMITVHVVRADATPLPAYQTDGAAGVDLHCAVAFEIAPMERRLVPTGIAVAIPAGYEGQIRPRSGLAIKHGISMVNTPGTIDSDYRGELCVIMINFGTDVVQFHAGDRIAQIVFCPIVRAQFVEVESLDKTERGSGGFGSTGTG